MRASAAYIQKKEWDNNGCDGTPSKDETLSWAHLSLSGISGTECQAFSGAYLKIDTDTCARIIYSDSACATEVTRANVSGACTNNGGESEKETCVTEAPSGSKDMTCLTDADYTALKTGGACGQSCGSQSPTTCAALQGLLAGCASSCSAGVRNFLTASALGCGSTCNPSEGTASDAVQSTGRSVMYLAVLALAFGR